MKKVIILLISITICSCNPYRAVIKDNVLYYYKGKVLVETYKPIEY